MSSKKLVADATSQEEKSASVSANAVKKSGKSALKGFRYIGKWCSVTLKDGVEGLVGTAEQFPFAVLLGLKGSGIELSYVWIGERTISSGDGTSRTYQQYSMLWNLE
jgi:hypothetical protein